MRHIAVIFLGFLLISSMVAADPLYKWVDDQGNVHYSDKPQPGAKKLVLPKLSTFSAPVPVAAQTQGGVEGSQKQKKKARPAAAEPYTGIAITAPADQQTLWNVDSMTVTVAVSPGLHPGDSVTITLDGNSQTVQGSSASFDNLDRGAHTVTASVGGFNAAPVSFFIQKNSIHKPPTH
jgi:hypothetical protein